MNALPNGWASVPLGQLASFEMGQAPPGSASNFNGEGTVFVKAGEFGRTFPEVREWTTKPLKFAARGDVLICVVGATAGKLNMGIDCAIGRSVAAIRPFPGVDKALLYRQLTLHVERLRKDSTGSAQGVISKGMLEQVPLAVPPQDEQRRIADKLDTVLTRVDAVNDRLARVAPLLKRFRQAVLAAATSGKLTEAWAQARTHGKSAAALLQALQEDHERAGGHERGNASEPTKEAHDLDQANLPTGWQIALLKDCCTPGRPITYGILKPGPELMSGVPYLRVADFPGNRLNISGVKRTSPEIDLQYKRARLVTGDLLLSIRGSVGRLVEIPPELHGANITQDTARLSISHRLCSRYLHMALLAPDMQRRMRNAVRGVAVRGINIGDVRALQIPLPPLEEQVEAARRADLLLAYADRLEARLQAALTAAERLTPALLAKAFRGELVPQDPNDEPASELLKRLAAQRAHAGTTASRPRGRKPAAQAT